MWRVEKVRYIYNIMVKLIGWMLFRLLYVIISMFQFFISFCQHINYIKNVLFKWKWNKANGENNVEEAHSPTMTSDEKNPIWSITNKQMMRRTHTKLFRGWDWESNFEGNNSVTFLWVLNSTKIVCGCYEMRLVGRILVPALWSPYNWLCYLASYLSAQHKFLRGALTNRYT